jgi:O-acetyl-ADP-ribose deacetylase (regulator of RNase III)
MVIIKIVNGDITETDCKYIAHQCNCNTVKSHGLSKTIATKWPWADVYSKRVQIGARNATTQPSIPGTIELLTNGDITVICLFAQWAPGKCGDYAKYYPKTYVDTVENRLSWFKECISKIDDLNLDEITMPFKIGCGLAGGDWKIYEQILQDARTKIILYSK